MHEKMHKKINPPCTETICNAPDARLDTYSMTIGCLAHQSMECQRRYEQLLKVTGRQSTERCQSTKRRRLSGRLLEIIGATGVVTANSMAIGHIAPQSRKRGGIKMEGQRHYGRCHWRLSVVLTAL